MLQKMPAERKKVSSALSADTFTREILFRKILYARSADRDLRFSSRSRSKSKLGSAGIQTDDEHSKVKI